MKSIKTHIGTFLAAALATGSFIACNSIDYPDRYEKTSGSPTVYYVRYADAEKADVLITGAYYNEIICIVGDNLKSVHKVLFNDVEGTLNSSYITDHTIVMNVASGLPTEKTDKMYLVNYDNDTTAFDFKALAPAPIVSGMSFEYAEAGTKVSLTGNYFIQDSEVPLTVNFTDADPVTTFDEITMTKITFTMPQASEGAVSVTTASGTGTSAFHYLDSRGMLFDFDGKTGLGNHGWHAQTITTGADAVAGNYLQFGDGTKTVKGDGSDWLDDGFHFEYWAGDYNNPLGYTADGCQRLLDIVDFTDYTNMAIKFELNIPSDYPWNGCPMQVILAPVSLISYGDAGVVDTYGETTGGCNNTYVNDASISLPRYLYEPWKGSGSFDTGGEWITVTLPISKFNQFWDGTEASGSLNAKSFASLEFFFAAGDGTGAECTPILKIDNIRAVPVN